MKKYRLTQDIMWCGFKILSKGQIVYPSTYDFPDCLPPDDINICTDPVTGSCQTQVPRSSLEEIS
jgi:hypothetical protein